MAVETEQSEEGDDDDDNGVEAIEEDLFHQQVRLHYFCIIFLVSD